MRDGKHDAFFYWEDYWGELFRDVSDELTTIVYGFKTKPDGSGPKPVTIQKSGACFGCLVSGSAKLNGLLFLDSVHEIREGMFFSTSNGCQIELSEDAELLIVQAIGYLGRSCIGGQIERQGRLKYIDNCSDSLLISPPLVGDPCLNHLHFPEGIDQTAHTHPSLRAGIIANGSGSCASRDKTWKMVAGGIFVIPRDVEHRFQTSTTDQLDVVVYHPDSDHGPSHEDHPMINRTWVGGAKIDNSNIQHQFAKIVTGKGGVMEGDL